MPLSGIFKAGYAPAVVNSCSSVPSRGPLPTSCAAANEACIITPEAKSTTTAKPIVNDIVRHALPYCDVRDLAQASGVCRSR